MPNVYDYLDELMSATYGDEVRTAIQNAILEVNDDATAALGKVPDGVNLNNSLLYRGTLTSANNLNDATDAGIYYITSSIPVNAPSNANTYSILFVLKGGGSPFTIQYYINAPRGDNNVYDVLAMRKFSGAPQSWGEWFNVRDISTGRGELLTTGYDLNNLHKWGIYSVANKVTSQSLLNSPYTEGIWNGGEGAKIITFATSGGSTYYLQMMYTHAEKPNVFIRAYTNNVWRPWYRLIRHDEIDWPYSSGDTFSITDANAVLNGFITESTTSINLTIYTPKSLANISTITVTAFTGTLRGISGYLDSRSSSYNFYNDSAFTFTARKMSNNMVRIYIKKSSAFTNITNNTPVSYYGTIRLSFS